MSVNAYSSNKGFTLVEVMIALVVMAIGMLGLASIQAVGLQNNMTAYNRTLAMQAAYNMADIIRTSKTTTGTITSTFNSVNSGIPNTAPTNCIVNDAAVACSVTDMAAADIYQWKLRLNDLLPSGRGKVSKSGDVYTIDIMWDEDRTGATGEDCNPADPDDLKCLTIEVQI